MPFRPLPPALAKIAKEELFEDPERNEEDVRILREWIEKQPHLKARTDDQFLLSFVRASKHSLERAKRKIDLYYTIRSALPEIFHIRDPLHPKVLDVIKLGMYIFPPKPLAEDGPMLCVVRPGVADPSKFPIYDSMRPGILAQDIGLISDDHAITSGILEILDCTGMTMAHFLQLDVVFIKKMSMLSGDASIFRHKGMHFINTTAPFEKIFNIFRSFMNEKQKSRLFVHGSNLESLYKHIPKHMLPVEYGGENGSVNQTVQHLEKIFDDNRKYLLEEEHYGTNEKLRAGDSKFNPETLFGVDGTFRKLEVD